MKEVLVTVLVKLPGDENLRACMMEIGSRDVVGATAILAKHIREMAEAAFEELNNAVD